MTMNLFLMQLALNLLTQALPLGLAVYLAIRFGVSHGGLQLKKPREREDK